MSSRLEVELVSPSTVYGYAEYCAIEGVGVVYWPGGSTRTTRT